MKKLFVSLLFFTLTSIAYAQNLEFIDSINISRERWRDSLLRIDKSYIPTGFLFEYSLAGINLSKFNGVNSDILKNEGEIFSLFDILNLSKVNNNVQITSADILFKQASEIYRNDRTIALAFIYQSYNRIRQTALSEGLFTIAADSVGILDVPNRTVSPYDNHELFAFAPFKQRIHQFNAISFSLPNELFYINGFTSVEIDFGDGVGYRNVSKGSNISIYYATEGTKLLTARITTTNGVRLAKAQIVYTRPETFSAADSTFNISVEPIYNSDDDYFGTSARKTTANALTNLVMPGAKIEIVNGCGGVFDKPIIIVEGFDPQGDFDIENYKFRFNQSRFTATMSNYGYDFVYVDFTDNTTYIENNAKVLEAVINKINEIKVGSHKSSIIGFSMGGLIARWCLKDMEDRNIDHKVENYFSYDAPHQGANSPLGLQYISKELERDLPYLRFSKSFRKTIDGLRSPAARQMLVTYADYNNAAFNWNPTLYTLDPLRASFAQQLVNKGYPQTTNNYGIAFGRGDNISNKNAGNGNQWTFTNPFNAGDLIFSGEMTFVLINASASVWAVPENNNKSSIATYNFGGLTFRKIFGISILPVLTIRHRDFKYRGLNSYDDAPGGFDVTQYSVKESWVGGIGGPADTFEHDGHCFLPTVSALDLQNQSYSSANNWQSNNLFYNIDNEIQNIGTVNGNDLITPSLSPFKAIITSTTGVNNANFEHNGNINLRFATFIQRKILKSDPVDCAGANGMCSLNPSIIGNVIGCTPTLSLSPVPNDVTINWSSKYGFLSILNGQGTSAVTIRRIQNATDTLFATLTNRCGAYLVVKKAVNPLSINFSPWGSGNGPCGEGAASIDIPSGNNFTWEVTGDLSINGGGQILSTTENTIVITGTSGTIIVRTSACGSPLYLDYNYEPYKRDIVVAANPMIGSDPLSASIQYIDFPYTEIKWYIDGVEVYNPWANPEMFFDANTPPCGMHVLSAKAVLTCGSTVEIGSVDIERYCTGWWRTMVVYPNPASSYIAIAPDVEKQKSLSAAEKSMIKEYEASMYDVKGKLLLKGRSSNMKLHLDTRSLKADYYYLHIRMDGDKKVFKQQIIIRN